MSDILEADDLFDQAEMLEPVEEVAEAASDEVVMSGQEVSGDPDSSSKGKKSLLKSFSVFDGLLLISLICICLATLILFLDLSKFGSLFGGFPWRTNEFLNQ